MHHPAIRTLCAKTYLKLRSYRKTASLLDIPRSTIHRWVSSNPFIQRQRKARKVTEEAVAHIRQVLNDHPFRTPSEIVSDIRDKLSLTLSDSTVRYCIRKCGYTRKKASRFVDISRVGLQRQIFARDISSLYDPERVVSIDESSFYFDMKPAYGRCRKSERLRVPARPGGRTRWSLIMAVTNQKVVGWELIKGAVNSTRFAQFMHTLNTDQRDIVLLDNLSSHRTDLVMDTMVERGLTPCFLPPYTPDFQPIEHCFFVVKNAFRKLQGPGSPDACLIRDPGWSRKQYNKQKDVLSEKDMIRRLEMSFAHLTPEVLHSNFDICWKRARWMREQAAAEEAVAERGLPPSEFPSCVQVKGI